MVLRLSERQCSRLARRQTVVLDFLKRKAYIEGQYQKMINEVLVDINEYTHSKSNLMA